MSRFQSMRERARPEEGEGTHAGVRASEAAEADEDIGWAGAPTSAELIADGISALEEGDAEGAVSAFDEARTYAESDLAENEALFYLGYAYSPQGDLREAIRSLRQTDLPTDSPLYHDRIVTLGQLYVDTFAYGEAAKLLTEYLDSGAIGAAADETRQDALLVLGLARLGTEDTERARARLEAAREINPESPAGTAADRVLRGL
jgi:tetratricopeptide (TPR) repeat protein